jgi:hypothetical protein
MRGACVALVFVIACNETHPPAEGGCMLTDAGASDAAIAFDLGPPMDVGPRSGIGSACSMTFPDGGFISASGTCDAGQLCLPPPAAMNGECTQLCSATMACPSDSVCFVAGANGVCFPRCTSDADCRTSDGFHCYPLGAVGDVCLAGEAMAIPMIPTGHRGCDACYTTSPGPHAVAALAHRVFTEPSILLSEGTNSCAEGNVVVSPTTGAIVEAYTGATASGSFIGIGTVIDGHSVASHAMLGDSAGNGLAGDPSLAYTRDGTLHALFMSGGADTMSMSSVSVAVRLVMLDSHDDGRTWSTAHEVVSSMTCGGSICDKPWLAIGPSPSGTGESLYVAYRGMVGGSPLGLALTRSDDGGSTWSPQSTIATLEMIDGSMTFPALATVVVDASGAVHVAHWGIGTAAGTNARLGDPSNRIVYRVSHDGGASWSMPSSVAGTNVSVAFGQPSLAIRGSEIDVAYLVGTHDGAWDVMLATSIDAGAHWARRKVNDEPDACATHLFPWIAADDARAGTHVTWLENRFGPGDVAYAFCPADATQPCGANEVVSDAAFTLTSSRDDAVWHGDYRTMLLTPAGDLWVGWSDTRTGTPAMYLAHGHP